MRRMPLLTSAPLVSPCGREVNVHFGARAARAGVAHHPEIIFLVAGDDVDLGIESGGAEFLAPKYRKLPDRTSLGSLFAGSG